MEKINSLNPTDAALPNDIGFDEKSKQDRKFIFLSRINWKNSWKIFNHRSINKHWKKIDIKNKASK